jgi:hypothetical protein
LSVPCRPGTSTYMLQNNTKGKICFHALPHATMASEPSSLLREGSDTATCLEDHLWHDDVDMVNKTRWQAPLRNARYRQVLWRYHQRFMHSRQLQWMIWCSDAYFFEKAYTSSPPTGMVLSGSHKFADLDASAWRRKLEHYCQIHET